MVFVYIFGIVIYLCLNGMAASKASDIAKDKGYDKSTWFHMCFWLGPVPYIIVAAMPDRLMRERLNETNALLKQMLGKEVVGSAPKAVPEKEDIAAILPDM